MHEAARLERELDSSSRKWVSFQEGKEDTEQPPLSSQLEPADGRDDYDAVVVGTGPALDTTASDPDAATGAVARGLRDRTAAASAGE